VEGNCPPSTRPEALDFWRITLYDNQLVRAINTGNAVVFVGSGPSSEMGYPRWDQLAQAVFETLLKQGKVRDRPSYESFLTDGKYPAVFREAEIDAGGRPALAALLRSLLQSPNSEGNTYKTLAQWPFAMYLTTNFENELAAHLRARAARFHVVQNSRADFRAITPDQMNLIVKLHGDLDHPQGMILTSRDYDDIAHGDEYAFLREKVQSIFQHYRVLVVGHSLYDPHIAFIMGEVQKAATLERPIFWIAPQMTLGQEREWRESSNIVVIGYDNSDGTHGGLRQVLRRLDRVIAPREQVIMVALRSQTKDESEAAASLLIYRRLLALRRLQEAPATAYLGPLVLAALLTHGDTGLSVSAITTRRPVSDLASTNEVAEVVGEVLRELMERHLVDVTNDRYFLTPDGREEIDGIEALRRQEERWAYDDFASDLTAICPAISDVDRAAAVDALKGTIVDAFRRRSLAIANAIFMDRSIRSDELSDIFDAVIAAAKNFPVGALREAFIEAADKFLISPSEHQRNYLEAISQGYFLFHLAGLDPACTRVRRDLFGTTAWFFDSSVLLPLIAVGSRDNAYSADLFRRLHTLHTGMCTTDSLLDETWTHLKWAMENASNFDPNSTEFLVLAMAEDGYKRNLFVDGYIRLAADGRVGTFEDYLQLAFPEGPTRSAIKARLKAVGVESIELAGLEGFEQNDWAEVEQLQVLIKADRIDRGIFRSDRQVGAEAEVLQMIQGLRQGKYHMHGGPYGKTYFVSRSRVLDRAGPGTDVTTWVPEALYRYLAALPGEMPDPGLLQQCMLEYYGGVEVMDNQRYTRFFGPLIDTAKASFAAERDMYLKETEVAYSPKLDEAFEQLPDLQKPFFVSTLARQAVDAAHARAEAAERQLEQEKRIRQELEQERARAWRKRDFSKEKQETARLKNLHDLKHLRKRARQAKERRRNRRP